MGCTPREEEESAAALLHALGVVSFLLYVSSVFISSHLLKKRSMAIEMGHSLSFLWLFVTHDLVITVPALACFLPYPKFNPGCVCFLRTAFFYHFAGVNQSTDRLDH
ncbi:hypothetical protein PCANC_17262 [Puccinia coronata f. sp. avenae]|uniref:Uncharacterized protein n=1 Tax=Puccinia coronata f. sp. avenae TaxID=200324 RepID=A0A2N5SH88_9BASI|nr:hypothetical protein PCANC_18130 [Puccinia coronata f. sp. avenae]PLW19904.1 hypothetical protein PCASD_13840 [Puccinia coronata f. sp. avenae]PLW32571.1 hypothetical protein PCANC_17262 [Puccinia coronata f. sp. avenae]